MANGRENLKPFATLTEEEQRIIRSKGGKASVKARQEKKTMAQMAEYVLSLTLTKEGKEKLKDMGLNTSANPTGMEAMMAGQLQGAIRGNAKCAEFLQNLLAQRVEEESSAESFINALKSDTEGTDYECIEE